MYADQPDHLRHAGGPWVGVAKAVEQALAVLEDGQRKLAEVWRSPAGATYLAEMDRVIQAMRATSEAARHNDQVMRTAAETLDAKQKDFAVLAGAPIPEDARQRYARAIVKSLDESYEQAIADFYPVPVLTEYDLQERPLLANESDTTPQQGRRPVGSAGDSSTTTDQAPTHPPSWVPKQPVGLAGGGYPSTVDSHPADRSAGPQLQAIAGGASYPTDAPPGTGTNPGVDTSIAHGLQVPSGSVGPPPGFVAGEAAHPPQARPAPPKLRYPSRSIAYDTPNYDAEPTTSRPTAAAVRGGRAGQSGAMVGGVPAGLPANGGHRPWQGYRRPLERFPTSQLAVVPPIIGPQSSAGAETNYVTTDYEDEYGNRIMIRRPNG